MDKHKLSASPDAKKKKKNSDLEPKCIAQPGQQQGMCSDRLPDFQSALYLHACRSETFCST